MDKESISAVLTNVLLATKVACCIAVTTVASLLFLEVRKTVKQIDDGTHPIYQRYDALYRDLHAVAGQIADLSESIGIEHNSDGNGPTIQELNAAIRDFRTLLAQVNGTADPNVHGTITRLNSVLDGLENGTLLRNQTNIAEIRVALTELTRTLRGVGDTVNTIAHPIDRVMGWNSFSTPKNTVHTNSSTGAAYNNNENKNDSGDGSKTTYTKKPSTSTTYGGLLGGFDIVFTDSDIPLC